MKTKVYISFLLLCGLAHADQVNCVKWRDSSSGNSGTYCKPFTLRASTGIQFTNDELGRILTISSTGAVPGAAGSNTQINYNSSGSLAGSSGLTWNNSTSTLTATHITGLDRKPFIDMVRDCGLVGDGVTDDSTAAQTCFNAYQGRKFFFPTTQASGACSYAFNATLYPKGEGTVIAGESAGFKNSNTQQGGTVLCWAAGVTGIEIDMTGNNCSGCQVENIALQGSEGTTHLVAPTLLNLPSGASLPLFKRTISSIQRATNVLTVTVNYAVNEGLTQSVGSTVLISGVSSDTTMNGRCIVATLVAGSGTATNPQTFTCAQNGSDAGPFVEGTVNLPTTGASTADGIRLCSNFVTIRQVVIHNFGRHGINADSSAAQAMCPSNFSDDLVLRDSMIVGNQGNGYLCNGLDCNAGYMSGNAFYYNVLYGIEDQGSLGNTWVGNQISNNGALWVSGTTPATKAISTISRTLASGVSTVTVVLSSANTNMKLGSCMVVAGVTDSSFNSTAGQCYFITTYTDSTHFQYEQPGAPANASSSGGTARMATFTEAYLSAGVDSGSVKVATQTGAYSMGWFSNYIEGSQPCKFYQRVVSLIGANIAVCASDDWKPTFIQSIPGTNAIGTNIQEFANEKDATNSIFFKAGKSSGAVRHTFFRWMNNNDNTDAWGLDVDPNGTSGSWTLCRGTAGCTATRRLTFCGTAAGCLNGVTRLSSESTSAVELQLDTNSGTGGVKFGSGGASPSTVATVDSAGLGTFNGGVKSGSSGSTIADSRELLQNVHLCGTTTTCANTANGAYRMIFGNVALSTGTALVGSITAFTSTSSFVCTGTDKTDVAAVQIVNTSTSSITINGTASDSIDYVCVGK